MLIAVTINKEDVKTAIRNIQAPLMSGTLLVLFMWVPLILSVVLIVSVVVGAVFPVAQVYPPSPADGPGTPP